MGKTQLEILLTDEKVAEKFVFMVLNLRPKEQIRSELQIVSRLTCCKQNIERHNGRAVHSTLWSWLPIYRIPTWSNALPICGHMSE